MAIVIIAVAAGIIGRTLIPFLQALKDKPEQTFDRKFLVPPIVSIIIGLIGLPLILTSVPDELLNLTAPTLANLAALFAIGWGTTDLVRMGQKLLAG